MIFAIVHYLSCTFVCCTLYKMWYCVISNVFQFLFLFFSLGEFYCCIKRNALQQTTDWKYFYIFFSHFDSLLVAGVLVEIGFKYEFRFDSYRFVWMNEIKYTKPKMLMDSLGLFNHFVFLLYIRERLLHISSIHSVQEDALLNTNNHNTAWHTYFIPCIEHSKMINCNLIFDFHSRN